MSDNDRNLYIESLECENESLRRELRSLKEDTKDHAKSSIDLDTSVRLFILFILSVLIVLALTQRMLL